MGNNQGWIKLHRSLLDHPLWLKVPFTYGQAWVDLLLLANHKPGTIWPRGIMIEVKRGQVGHSQRTLAARWGWTRNRVNHFLHDLETMQQIELLTEPQNKNVSTLISIKNYDQYQSSEATNEATNNTTDGPQMGHKRYQNKNEKNEKNIIISPDAEEVLSYLNQKTGKAFRNTKHIEARLKDGALVEDCKRVIDAKIRDPYFIEHPKFLNPETLFRPSNFDRYFNEGTVEKESIREELSCPRCGMRIVVENDLTETGCVYCEAGR